MQDWVGWDWIGLVTTGLLSYFLAHQRLDYSKGGLLAKGKASHVFPAWLLSAYVFALPDQNMYVYGRRRRRGGEGDIGSSMKNVHTTVGAFYKYRLDPIQLDIYQLRYDPP